MSDTNDRGTHGSTGGAYDPEREEVIGDAGFDSDDRLGLEVVAFDTAEGQYPQSQPDDYDVSVDLFIYDPSQRESP